MFFLSSLTKISACCLRLAYGFGLIKIFNKHKLNRNKVEEEATQQMGVTEGLRRMEKDGWFAPGAALQELGSR